MSLSGPVSRKLASLTAFFQPREYSPPCSPRALMWNRKCLSNLEQHQGRVANAGNVIFLVNYSIKEKCGFAEGKNPHECDLRCLNHFFGCSDVLVVASSSFFLLQRRQFCLCSSRLINASPPVWLVTSWWPQYSLIGEELRDDINLC